MTRRLSALMVLLLSTVLIPGCAPPSESGSGTASPASAPADSPGTPDDAPAEPADPTDGETADSPPEPATEEPVTEEPATEEPATEEPATEEPATEEPATEEPATDEPATEQPVSQQPAGNKPETVVTSGDWNMFGDGNGRNMVNSTTGIRLDFEPPESGEGGTGIKWSVSLGSQTYGNPVVADGRVFVGTNNGGEYREQHKGDRGVILCFDEEDGTFLWQLTREKLPAGRVNDWPEQGICSTPCIVDGRMYVATNRCELMCIDVEGFHDGENDGPYQDEVDKEENDADIIWVLDMIDELGVFPHNLATSSPLVHEDMVLLLTSNGVDEAHLEVPSPRAPSFIGVNKDSGEVVWEADFPSNDSRAPERFANILHGQWGSPALATIEGRAQVFMPGGDGVLYSLDATTGELIWWFDLNPKDSVWELGGSGTRNAIIATPVVIDSHVILAVGQDPEHGEGVGHLYRIDATKTGDISPQVADGDSWIANPNSGQVWHYGGIDADGSITGEEEGLIFRRTMSTVAVADGFLYAADLSGFLHCIDSETGKKNWVYDSFAAIWGSPMVVDGTVLIGDEDGELTILKTGKQLSGTTSLPQGTTSVLMDPIDISQRPPGIKSHEIEFVIKIPQLSGEELPIGATMSYEVVVSNAADMSNPQTVQLDSKIPDQKSRDDGSGARGTSRTFNLPPDLAPENQYVAVKVTNSGEGDASGHEVSLRVDAWAVKTFDSTIYSTPTVANGTLFVSSRSRLYAFTISK